MTTALRPDDFSMFSGLCGSWLHQDCSLEDPDVCTAVDRFLEHEEADAAQHLIGDLERLRAHYYPPGAGLTVDAWLANLLLRAAGPRRRPL